MTDYVPTKEIGKALLHVRHMLALSSTLQGFSGIGSYANAFNRVYYYEIPSSDGGTAVDMSKPAASVWPHGLRFNAPAPDIIREVGQIHVYLCWPTNTSLTGWNNQRLEAFDKLQGWAVDVMNLSAREDDGPNGPIVTGESHLSISMTDAPFNEWSPAEARPPGAAAILAQQSKYHDFQWRAMVLSIGEGE